MELSNFISCKAGSREREETGEGRLSRQSSAGLSRAICAAACGAAACVDSFLIDPFLLLGLGVLYTGLLRLDRSGRDQRPVRIILGAGTVVVFWIVSVSLYLDLGWIRWMWELCGAQSGRDWMLNSGVFHFNYGAAPT